MSDDATLREPPVHVIDGDEQDRRLVRLMLELTPQQRLQALRNWARLVAAANAARSGRARPKPP